MEKDTLAIIIISVICVFTALVACLKAASDDDDRNNRD